MRPKVLSIAAEGTAECSAGFVEVAQLLKAPPVNFDARRAPDIAAACSLPETSGWFPDLIVVAQSWPDEYSAAEVHRLLSMFPLARLVCCYGNWCDSDGRNRSIWPPGSRIMAENAPARVERELEFLTGSTHTATVADAGGISRRSTPVPGPGLSVLPLTASRTEIFAHDYGLPMAPTASRAAACVVSPDRTWRDMLVRALAIAGHHVTKIEDLRAGDQIYWDADPWSDERQVDLRSLRREVPHGCVTACVGFTRWDLARELKAAGATGMAFKLAPLATSWPL